MLWHHHPPPLWFNLAYVRVSPYYTGLFYMDALAMTMRVKLTLLCCVVFTCLQVSDYGKAAVIAHWI